MRIVSWNLHGAAVPGRASLEQQHRAWTYMREVLHADLIFAQEVTTGGVPESILTDWSIVLGEKGRHRKDWNWGSVIAARPSLCLRERKEVYCDAWLAQLYDLVLVGEISVEGEGSLIIASVHTAAMPVKDWIHQYATTLSLTSDELASLRRPGCNEDPYINDFAFTALERLVREKRFFVSGDWNTCRRYPGGPGFFERARDAEWICCIGEPEIATYFGRDGAAYQLDHAFSDPKTAAALSSARVVSNDIVRALSDHIPIVFDLAGERATARSPAHS